MASSGCSLEGAGCFSRSLNFVSTILFLFLCLTKSFEFLIIKILDPGRGPPKDLDPDRIQWIRIGFSESGSETLIKFVESDKFSLFK
jgi:hypothetical protein